MLGVGNLGVPPIGRQLGQLQISLVGVLEPSSLDQRTADRGAAPRSCPAFSVNVSAAPPPTPARPRMGVIRSPATRMRRDGRPRRGGGRSAAERLSTSGLSALDHGARSANRAAERRLQLPVNDLATGAGEPADNLGLATDQRGFSTSLPALARMPFNS